MLIMTVLDKLNKLKLNELNKNKKLKLNELKIADVIQKKLEEVEKQK